jgi:hypothetical protein
LSSALTPVLAAMNALDEAVANHHRILDRLQGAFEEGVRLDSELRRIDPADDNAMLPVAQALAFAVTLTQSLANREMRARLEVRRRQEALAQVRRNEYLLQFAELRLLLEDDAARMHVEVREHEEALRQRVAQHGRLLAEAELLAKALPEEPAVRELLVTDWSDAVGSCCARSPRVPSGSSPSRWWCARRPIGPRCSRRARPPPPPPLPPPPPRPRAPRRRCASR